MSVFLFEKCLILLITPVLFMEINKSLLTDEPQMKISFLKTKHESLIHSYQTNTVDAITLSMEIYYRSYAFKESFDIRYFDNFVKIEDLTIPCSIPPHPEEISSATILNPDPELPRLEEKSTTTMLDMEIRGVLGGELPQPLQSTGDVEWSE